MKHKYICGIVNTCQYVLVSIQENPIWQGVQLALSIITSVVLCAYQIWKWWKEATKDKKITKDEVEEGFKIINDGLEDVNDKVNGKDKRDNG